MCRAPQWLLPVSGVLLIAMAACGTSSLVRTPVEEPDLVNVRTEYLARNPDSPYRDYVSRGEIVKGMDTFGVLAAWGLPTRRVQEDVDFERWLYVDVDDVSKEPVGYELEFRKGVLTSWDTHRGAAGLKLRESKSPSDAPKPDPQKKPLPTS